MCFSDLDGLYAGWVQFERGAVADGGRRRTEILYLNPAATEARGLFGSLEVTA